jgi:hypothetical protein
MALAAIGLLMAQHFRRDQEVPAAEVRAREETTREVRLLRREVRRLVIRLDRGARTSGPSAGTNSQPPVP